MEVLQLYITISHVWGSYYLWLHRNLYYGCVQLEKYISLLVFLKIIYIYDENLIAWRQLRLAGLFLVREKFKLLYLFLAFFYTLFPH